jgi:hypothetical protein
MAGDPMHANHAPVRAAFQRGISTPTDGLRIQHDLRLT